MKIIRPIFLCLATLFLSSCEMVEQKFYPFLDYVVVEKNTQDIYARNDAYAADTMCLDTSLVEAFRLKQNISAKWQYTLAKPKVEWQRCHLSWLESKSARSTRWFLFRLLFAVALLGFWLPTFWEKWYEKRHDKKRDKLTDKADMALLKGNLEEADRLYAKCEEMGSSAFKCAPIERWTSRIMPYTMLLLLLIEGAYLFMFNFNMSMVSPARIGFWSSLINLALLFTVLLAQVMLPYVYSSMLADANSSESSLWHLPLKWSVLLAIPTILLINTFVLPFDAAILILGIICCVYVLVRNKAVHLFEVKIYALCMLLSYVFMYFVSYALLVVFTVGIIVIGCFFGLKMVGRSVQYSYDNQNIRERMRRNPTMTYDEASRKYYEEKRAELREKMNRSETF